MAIRIYVEKLTYLCCLNLYLFCLVHRSEQLHVAFFGFKVWSEFEKVQLRRTLRLSESPTLLAKGRSTECELPGWFPPQPGFKTHSLH